MKYILLFLLGGTILAGNYYLYTVAKNAAYAAWLTVIPMSLISALFVPNKKTLKIYAFNVMTSIFAGLIPWIIYYLFIYNYTNYNIQISLIVLGFFWVLSQYLKYRICNIYFPTLQNL